MSLAFQKSKSLWFLIPIQAERSPNFLLAQLSQPSILLIREWILSIGIFDTNGKTDTKCLVLKKHASLIKSTMKQKISHTHLIISLSTLEQVVSKRFWDLLSRAFGLVAKLVFVLKQETFIILMK